jgi:hypothetical protein
VDWKKIVSTARVVLGKLTDLLLIGRNAGWWSRRNTTSLGLDSRGDIHKPGTK